jgi:hypothetical protein
MGIDTREQSGDARATLVGDERDTVAAVGQFGGERMGGHHVPAGTAGREDEMARDAHLLFHFTT